LARGGTGGTVPGRRATRAGSTGTGEPGVDVVSSVPAPDVTGAIDRSNGPGTVTARSITFARAVGPLTTRCRGRPWIGAWAPVDAGRGHRPARARTATSTRSAPSRTSTSAAARTVAPVVSTSS